jgi:hypothetical protein
MTIFSFSYNILRVILVQEYNLSFFWCTKFALMWIASSDASSCEFYQVYSYLSPDFIRVNTMMPHACIFEVLYYLIECRRIAMLLSLIQLVGADAFRSTSIAQSLLKTEVWLGLIMASSSWRRRKTRHRGFHSSNCSMFSLFWLTLLMI